MSTKKATKKAAKVEKDLFEYVKINNDGKKHKVGVLYAAVHPSQPAFVCIGASRVNLKKGDEFVVEKGIQVAKGRALHGRTDYPLSLKRKLIKFQDRCIRYYKTKKIFGLVYNEKQNMHLMGDMQDLMVGKATIASCA